MTEFIQKEFTKIVTDTINRFAKEKEVPEKEIQVYFGLDEQGENVYKICHNYQPFKHVGFTDNGILKGKMDFSGKSKYVPPVIKDILESLAQERKMSSNAAGIMVIKTDSVERPIGLYLYNGTQPESAVTMEEIFSKIKLF